MKKTVLLTLLIFVLSLLLGAYAAEEYGIGQPWNVDGQWTLTVESIEETQDRNPYSEKNPAAVYIVTYTYSNLGYEDSMGIMDGLYLSLDNRIVDCDGMMGYSYPASYDYNAQEVPIGAKCKAQAAIGVDTAGLPIKLYVDTYDGNGNQQSAVFVLGGEAPAAPAPAQTVEENDEVFTAEETLTIADIIPDNGVWGQTSDAFQNTYPGSYSSAQVGKAPALVKSNLSVEGYPMSAYYVFADGNLSKITYVLMDDSDKSAVKACASKLTDAMSAAVGAAGTEGKGVIEWNDGTIQIGTAKLKNYTGKDNLSACVIFKQPNTAAQPTEKSKPEDESSAAPKYDNLSLAGNVDGIEVTDWALVKEDYGARLILEFTNTGSESIPDMEVEMVLYDKGGNIIDTESDGHDVFLPGSTVVTQKSISKDVADAFGSLKINIDTEKYSNHYVNHVENLDIKGSVNGGKVFLQVRNNDPEEIDEIEIVVVFYKDGKIAGAKEQEITHLSSGQEHVFEFSGYESAGADSYRYFVNQAHTF